MSKKFEQTDVDESKVIKKGYLTKDGKSLLSGKTKYMFYLEGNLLKYAEKHKPIKETIDLTDVVVERREDSRRKLTIFQGKNKIKLRAENSKEREEWVEALKYVSLKGYVPKVNEFNLEEETKGGAIIPAPTGSTKILELYVREDQDSIPSKEDSKEEDEAPGRAVLPYLKDPKIKYSVWTILKDSIGKDLTKISLPVYFNHPLNTHQRIAGTMEYSNLLDEATKQEDPLKRIAYICAFYMTTVSGYEKGNQKPFNPLLAETYELVTKDFKMISEAVSHHPPIVSYDVQGFAGWKRSGSQRPRKPKFNGNSITITQFYKEYLELLGHNEKYEVNLAPFTINNLIFGTPYIDVINQCEVKSMTRLGQYGVMNFKPRGNKESKYFRVEGEVFNEKKECVYKLQGRWSESCTITEVKTGKQEVIWKKTPYPENWEYQYGLTLFMIQLNYLPNFLKNKLPPTDTRLRPDQRALENGDMKLAISWKDKLEEKQRLIRKYNEQQKIEVKPYYFEEYKNPHDNDEIYYRYNGQYFEKERQERNWSRLPDIFSEQIPTEVEEAFKKK